MLLKDGATVQKQFFLGFDTELYEVIFDDLDDIVIFADVLAEYIICKYPKIIITGIINFKYANLDLSERTKICNNVLMQAALPDKTGLKLMLMDYISASSALSLNGFVLFRMKDYITYLESLTDMAVSNLLAEYEYEEFTELMKFFVDIQKPVVNEVHIINNGNKYEILDSDFKIITNEYISDFLNELHYGKINYDDLLLSALITLAPNKITIYNCNKIKNANLLKTLKHIFNDKLNLCSQELNLGMKTQNESNISKNINLS